MRYLLDTNIVSSPIAKEPNPHIVKRIGARGSRIWGAPHRMSMGRSPRLPT